MMADVMYRLRALFQRERMDRELDSELRFHIEQEIEKQVQRGVPRPEAERRARLQFGGLEQVRESTRDARGVAAIDALHQDLRYAWRSVRTRPGFSAAVVLTLGLGIGANVAMFGVVDRLLLRAPAYMESPERVHRAYMTYIWDRSDRMDRNFAYLRYENLRQFTRSFDAMAAFGSRRQAVGRGAAARELEVATVSASLFDFFNARPALGRFFTAQDDMMPSGTKVAVLGHGYWQSQYGGAREVLGEQLHIGDATYTVIGVAPEGFEGVADGEPPIVYVPITAYAHTRDPKYTHTYNWSWAEILLRRAAGVSEAAATADLTAAFARSWEAERVLLPQQPPAQEARVGGVLSPIHFARGPDAGPQGRVATWVLGVAFVVLLIAAANVINLLLARAVHRRREIALRLALGVSRRRLLQQLFTETLLLAVLGGLAGVAAARWGGGALRGLFLSDRASSATDMRMLLFAAALTVAVALLTGLAPALQALRGDVASTLKAGMRDSAYRSSRVRTSLLLLQGTLCVVLLVGAGLFVRSLLNVQSLRLGYDAASLMVVESIARNVDLTPQEMAAVAERVHAAALQVPGVANATLISSAPFYMTEGRGAPHVAGRDSLNLLGRYTLQSGSTSYFETTGTRILRGRGFEETDVAGAPYVVVISESMARAIWPNEEALGKQLRFGGDTMPMLTVVGIAEDVTASRLGAPAGFWYYVPTPQYQAMWGRLRPYLIVRAHGRSEGVLEAVRQRLQRELPGDSYVRVLPFSELLEPQQRSWRVGATMFVIFAGLALVLATIGLYSVIAYTVAQRTRELGVRIALGASMGNVVRMVLREGMLFALVGIAVGGGTALFASRWIEPLLFSTSPTDPAIYLAVAGILITVAVVATVRPALRASRVDPTIALRAE